MAAAAKNPWEMEPDEINRAAVHPADLSTKMPWEMDENEISKVAKSPDGGFLSRLGYNTLSALPAVGSIGGGMLGGAAAGPVGAVAGAGAGAVAGKSLEQSGKKYFFDEGPQSRSEQYSDIAKSIPQGMTQEMGGQVIGKGIDAAGNILRNQAGRSAYKALGPTARDVKNTPMNDIVEKGQNLRDTGIVRTVPTSYEGLANRAEQVLEEKGPQFDQMTKQIGEQSGQTIPKEKLIAKIQREMSPDPDIPTLKHTSDQVEEMLNQVRAGKGELSVTEAQDLKSRIGKILDKRGVWTSLKKGNDINTENQFLVSYYHGLNSAVEDAGDSAAEKVGGDIGNQWRQLKQDYGTAKEAYKIASNKAGREYVNRFVSPSDYISAGTAMIAHGNTAGVATGAANMVGRKFGNQAISNASAAGANALKVLPDKTVEIGSKSGIGLLNKNKKEDE